MNQPQTMLQFGIGGQIVTAFGKPNLNEKKPDKVCDCNSFHFTHWIQLALSTVDNIANALFSVLSAVSPVNNPVGTTWHARWLR